MQLTYSQLWNRGRELAKTWKLKGKSRLVISHLETGDGLTALCAGLGCGLDLILDEKGTHSIAAQDIAFSPSPEFVSTIAPPYSSPHASSFELLGDVPRELRAALKDRTIYFATSGTTSTPKLVAKSIQGLLLETQQLLALYGLNSSSAIVSLVRPFHIYGFLHSFLLPILSSCRVQHWNTGFALPSLEDGFIDKPDLLITVPAHLSLIAHIQGFTAVKIIVSSGAPLRGPRFQRFLKEGAEGRSHARPLRFLEILGSTETGGIAFRRADLNEEFQLFEGVRIAEDESGAEIFSSFLYPDLSVRTADRFERTGDGRIRHLGRGDRVFKYSGLRYSLTEIEAALAACTDQSAVACFFDEDLAQPQGGRITAFIEAAPSDFRSRYAKDFPLPFPQRLVFLPVFPRDAQGKVTRVMLEEAEARSLP
jgi:acyl-coenzyme A synthetase/AMP-(fatty) acid ligase